MKTNLTSYFSDLSIVQSPLTFGPGRTARKNFWTIACYLSFIIGIFARQITQFPKVQMNLGNINIPIIVASVIIGLAFFPFIVRLIIKLAKNLESFRNNSSESLNMIHVLCSFSWGFFIDLIIGKMNVLVTPFFDN